MSDVILKGNLKLTGSNTDVSAETTGVTIKQMVKDIQVPATLAAGPSHEGGSSKYSIQIDYLSVDGSSGILFPILWAAVGTASKEVSFTCTLRDGGQSPTNPEWSGTFIVSGTDLGGDAEALSEGSITCTMTGAPGIDRS